MLINAAGRIVVVRERRRLRRAAVAAQSDVVAVVPGRSSCPAGEVVVRTRVSRVHAGRQRHSPGVGVNFDAVVEAGP